jgi:hypothetical protein
MRSTIHAVCCGTKRTIVLAGSRGFWKYEGSGPPKLLPLEEPEKLAGRRVRDEVVKDECGCGGRRRRALEAVLPARRAALGGGSEGIVGIRRMCLAVWYGVLSCM